MFFVGENRPRNKSYIPPRHIYYAPLRSGTCRPHRQARGRGKGNEKRNTLEPPAPWLYTRKAPVLMTTGHEFARGPRIAPDGFGGAGGGDVPPEKEEPVSWWRRLFGG